MGFRQFQIGIRSCICSYVLRFIVDGHLVQLELFFQKSIQRIACFCVSQGAGAHLVCQFPVLRQPVNGFGKL